MKPKLSELIKPNRIGWEAIRHKDGWWIGTDNGVTCYGDHDLACAALTIVWQREGGGRLDYRIQTFTGADHKTGEHTPKLSAVEALKIYDENAKWDK